LAKRQQGLPKELITDCQTQEDKDAFRQQVASAMPVLDKYKKAIEVRLQKSEDNRETDYDCPSWSHKQADANGYQRAMKDILKLFPRP